MKNDNSDLLYRFTAWIKVVVRNAKIDYLRKMQKHSGELSLDDESFKNNIIAPNESNCKPKDDFDFDCPELEAAVAKLSPRRKQVIFLMYVQNLTGEEIARELHCSLQQVYNLRSQAIRDLKTFLSEVK